MLDKETTLSTKIDFTAFVKGKLNYALTTLIAAHDIQAAQNVHRVLHGRLADRHRLELGHRGERPGAADGTGAADASAAGEGAGAAGADAPDTPISSKSFLSMREVSLPPGTHRFSRSSFF